MSGNCETFKVFISKFRVPQRIVSSFKKEALAGFSFKNNNYYHTIFDNFPEIPISFPPKVVKILTTFGGKEMEISGKLSEIAR